MEGDWKQVIPAGATVALKFPSDASLMITKIVMNGDGECEVVGKIKAAESEEEQVVTFCKLNNGARECEVLHVFSPLNMVSVMNNGNAEVTLIGACDDVFEGEEEEEEEEEEDEGLSADEIQARFKAMAEKQGERPPKQKRGKKGKKKNAEDVAEEDEAE